MRDILGSPLVVFPFMVGSTAFASLFALGLKGLFLVTTVFGMTGLWVAVLADTGATALVTLNALRLLRFKGAQSVDDDRDTGHPTRSPQPQAAH